MDQPIPIQAARSLRMLAFNEILDCDIPALTPDPFESPQVMTD